MEPDEVGGTPEASAGEYNLRILQPAFGYIRAHFGEETLRGFIREAGLPPTAATRKSVWISHAQLESLLASLRDKVDSDEEFRRACAYEFKKQYGPLLLILRCMSVRGLVELAAHTGHVVCRVGHYEAIEGSRTSSRFRYHTRRKESRLVCLSRQGAAITTPTLFTGMAPGKLKEHACVAYGDEYCEYELSWNEPLRLGRVILGFVAGLVAAIFAPVSLVNPFVAFVALPLLGILVGVALEMRRVLSEHADFSARTALETEQVVRSHAEAMDALTELQYRERDWNRRVEAGVASRTEKLNLVVRRLRSALRKRGSGRPGREEDQAMDTLTSLADNLEDGDGAHVHAMETAVEKVSRLVGELVDIARSDPTQQPLTPASIEVDELVVRIRRHLNATVIGRDVRITVFQTREAPITIFSVRSVLERILDNLLFSAGRETDHGSINVEIGGTPGSLLIKISDTGRGLTSGRLEQVFGHTTGTNSQAEHSSGLGSAARLLDRIGGRLEIMSEPNVGTTLWVYVPIKMPTDDPTAESDTKGTSEEDSSAQVVAIRPPTDSGISG